MALARKASTISKTTDVGGSRSTLKLSSVCQGGRLAWSHPCPCASKSPSSMPVRVPRRLPWAFSHPLPGGTGLVPDLNSCFWIVRFEIGRKVPHQRRNSVCVDCFDIWRGFVDQHCSWVIDLLTPLSRAPPVFRRIALHQEVRHSNTTIKPLETQCLSPRRSAHCPLPLERWGSCRTCKPWLPGDQSSYRRSDLSSPLSRIKRPGGRIRVGQQHNASRAVPTVYRLHHCELKHRTPVTGPFQADQHSALAPRVPIITLGPQAAASGYAPGSRLRSGLCIALLRQLKVVSGYAGVLEPLGGQVRALIDP
ncbi:hypothetical protein DB88DRAFT_471629 [Papiliotrema laurentii]|uniref:Uncharacterized protein n=1 Tax=Papiliotrema laurentii TaxID=5418 RepID=A0AAD9L741_PAPLA|nr:hypothetical protein DB88DRAFT_471629 [Papiliotrema laurentii]